MMQSISAFTQQPLAKGPTKVPNFQKKGSSLVAGMQTDFSPSVPVQFGAETAGWKKALKISLLSLLGLGGYGFVTTTEYNHEGTHSLVYDKSAGGYEEKAQGPGLVYLGFKAAVPFLNAVYNVPMNTSSQSVIEVIEPSTKEGTKIPKMAIVVDFQVKPDHLKAALNKIDNSDSAPTVPDTTTFVKTDDAKIQRIYLQFIRNNIRAGINDLTTAYEGDKFHTITEFLHAAFNEGLINYQVKRLDGSKRTIDFPKLQDKINQEFGDILQINHVRVVEFDLDANTTKQLEDRAQKPLQELISNLQRDLEATKALKNKEEGLITAKVSEEEARQNGLKNQLQAEASVTVATLTAEVNRLNEEAKVKGEAISGEGEKEATILQAKTDEEVAAIKGKARQDAAQTRAEADALVTQAQGDARAKAAKLLAEVYQKHPNLLKLERIKGGKAAIAALASNPNFTVTFVDPSTGITMSTLNIGNGAGLDSGKLVHHVLGERVSKIVTPEAKANPAASNQQ